jgi:chemotaxis protein methyltransferase CheR
MQSLEPIRISDAEFAKVRAFALDMAGISLSPAKKTLVVSRWSKRLAHHGLSSFGEYLKLLQDGRSGDELQISLDLLTTNETYFFREPKHFDFMRDRVLPGSKAGGPFRVWSAACSSGEEPYSIAMQLAAELSHSNWEVLGTDISMRVLQRARMGLYDTTRIEGIPPDYLRRFCLKGIGPYANKLLIDQALRQRLRFERVNLTETLPNFGQFDVIFLRNVMIYFDLDTKAKVVGRLLPYLKPGGYFLIGHCDTLHGIDHDLEPLGIAIYRKPAMPPRPA